MTTALIIYLILSYIVSILITIIELKDEYNSKEYLTASDIAEGLFIKVILFGWTYAILVLVACIAMGLSEVKVIKKKKQR